MTFSSLQCSPTASWGLELTSKPQHTWVPTSAGPQRGEGRTRVGTHYSDLIKKAETLLMIWVWGPHSALYTIFTCVSEITVLYSNNWGKTFMHTRLAVMIFSPFYVCETSCRDNILSIKKKLFYGFNWKLSLSHCLKDGNGSGWAFRASQSALNSIINNIICIDRRVYQDL